MDNETEFGNSSFMDSRSNSSAAYLQRAASAVEAGDNILGIHLYLAAYERALCEGFVPSEAALAGMDKAWDLAVATKQRSLAEYIFEKLEHYWSPEEMAARADELQRMAFDKLEEYGFDREAVEDVAEMINSDLMGEGPDVLCEYQDSAASQQDAPNLDELMDMLASATQEVLDGKMGAADAPADADAAANAGAAANGANASADANGANANAAQPSAPSAPKKPVVRTSTLVIPQRKEEAPAHPQERFDYKSLVGFAGAVSAMNELGVGCSDDPEFNQFVQLLNQRHGLPTMPALGTLVFNCAAREDANYFMVATVGELKMPAVRMRVDHNAQGQAILCVTASPDFKSRLQTLARQGFEGPTALILEDLDLWDLPVFDGNPENIQGFMQMQLSRGAREALALIQSALENPEVTVFISASELSDIDGYFYEMIGPHRVINIDLPDADERRQVWRACQTQHPSLRGLDVSQLVDFSRTLSRYEIFAIANEAVEDAYRESLQQRRFCAVNTDDMLMRLANFQPLESDEYHRMEDLIAGHFRAQTHNFDDLLKD